MKKKLSIIFFFIIIGSLFFIIYTPCRKKDKHICKLNINNNSIYLTVAYSKKMQAKGLMGVKSLKENRGMIFVYDKPEFLSFWMKNTLIPLSIAYVDEKGTIVSIYNMETPAKNVKDADLPVYTSPSKVKYAIEMNKGWFTSRGIKTGTTIAIPKNLE